MFRDKVAKLVCLSYICSLNMSKILSHQTPLYIFFTTEAESGENHGVWDPMPELTITSLQSRLQYMYHLQPYARVDLNPMPESTLSPNQGLRIWSQEATCLLFKVRQLQHPTSLLVGSGSGDAQREVGISV